MLILGEFHEEVDFDERVRRLQNDFGVDVLFTWGIIEQEGKNRMALVAGGWNDALLVEEGDQSEYLKLMTMYTMLLAQAEEENVPVDLTDLVQTPEVPFFNYVVPNNSIKICNTRKYPLRGYILGVLTHTTAWDQLWGDDIF